MSAADKLRALDMHSAVLNGRYTLRSALPELIAVVEAAEDAISHRSAVGPSPCQCSNCQAFVGILAALAAKLGEPA